MLLKPKDIRCLVTLSLRLAWNGSDYSKWQGGLWRPWLPLAPSPQSGPMHPPPDQEWWELSPTIYSRQRQLAQRHELSTALTTLKTSIPTHENSRTVSFQWSFTFHCAIPHSETSELCRWFIRWWPSSFNRVLISASCFSDVLPTSWCAARSELPARGKFYISSGGQPSPERSRNIPAYSFWNFLRF